MLTPYFREATIDDLMREAIQAVREHGRPVTATRGSCLEVTGVMLELTNVRARLSRTESKGTPFSALGEFCWYLSGRSDHKSIEYYVKDAYDADKDVEPDGTIAGAYGPRLIGPRDDDQLERIVALLERKETTRQAVLRLFDASDLRSGQRDVPCTCAIQFLNREGRLEAVTFMRSNDVYLGFPHDVFCFTLLQEWVARRLGVEVGCYKHAVGSLHLYDKHTPQAQRFLDEGFQSTLTPMPSMPKESPVESLAAVLDAEDALRMERPDFARAAAHETALDAYWSDLVRLLRAYRHWKDGDRAAILRVRDSMVSPIYFTFLDRKAQNAATRPAF
jgi:thymidylate synthase